MKVKEAIALFRYYQQANQRKRTMESYRSLLQRFEQLYADRLINSMKSDELYQFLEDMTGRLAKSTRRLRYAQVKAFFNFIIDKCSLDMKNPCHTSLLSKTFRMARQAPRAILDKEIVDEMIYNTRDRRNRLILEFQTRCGLRIGEVLKIRASDVSERRLTINLGRNGGHPSIVQLTNPLV